MGKMSKWIELALWSDSFVLRSTNTDGLINNYKSRVRIENHTLILTLMFYQHNKTCKL